MHVTLASLIPWRWIVGKSSDSRFYFVLFYL